MLCAFCSSASSLEIWTWIFSKSVTMWTALQIPLWSKPHLVFRYKVRNRTHLSARYTNGQHQSQLVWNVQIWPISASHFRELVYGYVLGCLWVVTVCCNTAGHLLGSQSSPAPLRPDTTFKNKGKVQSKSTRSGTKTRVNHDGALWNGRVTVTCCALHLPWCFSIRFCAGSTNVLRN